MPELLEHFNFFSCISTRITAVMVTAFFQVRRAGHNKHFSVSERNSDVGVGCTHHVGASESCLRPLVLTFPKQALESVLLVRDE